MPYGRHIISLMMILGLVGFSTPVVDAQDQRTSDTPRAEKKEENNVSRKEIKRLIHQLDSKKRRRAMWAQQQLLQIGARVIPILERQIRTSDAGAYYRLLKQLKALHNRSGQVEKEEASNSNENSFSVDDELKNVRTKDNGETKNDEDGKAGKMDFLTQRYRDALQQFQNGNFTKARRLASSLLVVAPDVSFRNKLEQFIRKCKERLVNASILRSRISTEKFRYQWGEVVHVTFSIKNVSDKPVHIYFDAPPEKDMLPNQSEEDLDLSGSDTKNGGEGNPTNGTKVGGADVGQSSEQQTESNGKGNVKPVVVSENTSSTKKLFVEVFNEQVGLEGSTVTKNRYKEYDIPARIRLEPGAEWRKRAYLKTTEYKNKYVLRRFRMEARTRPVLILKGEKKMGRWIVFREARFELYPEGMRKALPSSFEKIQRHLISGNLYDVFFLTFLLPEDQKTRTVKYFLEVLPYLKKQPARTIMFLLRELTGREHYYKRSKWVEWGQKKYDIETQPPQDETPSELEQYFNE